MCVCLSATISSELRVRSSPTFVHINYGRGGSVFLWQSSDTLRIYGVIDDVIHAFAHKLRLLEVASEAVRLTRSLGIGA